VTAIRSGSGVQNFDSLEVEQFVRRATGALDQRPPVLTGAFWNGVYQAVRWKPK